MQQARRTTLFFLLGGTAVVAAAVIWTGRGAATSEAPGAVARTREGAPLRTAQVLAATAVTADERELAQEALRIADHATDLAFSEALRRAAQAMRPLSPEAEAAQARVDEAQKLLDEDQARLDRLTRALSSATDERKATLEGDLEVAKAQVELDKDEIEDARQDLARTGGDPRARIQRMVEEHEAGVHGQTADGKKTFKVLEALGGGGFTRHLSDWAAWRDKVRSLAAARDEALDAAARVARRHDALERRIAEAAAASPELSRRAGEGPAAAPAPGTPPAAPEGVSMLVSSTRRLSADKKGLATLDRLASDHKDLADVYARWIGVAGREGRAALHAGLNGVLLLLGILLAGTLLGWWLERLVGTARLERRRTQQLRTLVHLALRVTGVVLVLFLSFGTPRQMGTFLGLYGAGLTVALKDFIVGAVGWFVLMGRNGIRVGDSVEINGVSGEVVELGPLHTVLLETGNWTESGHPTGRRVTFVNSFAVEGHYFNFSTSGQWMWDEVLIDVPGGRDPYRVAELLVGIASKETSGDARLAEAEWPRVAHSQELRRVSAEPAVVVRPTAAGYEVRLRYIIRASERHVMRSRLYRAAVESLGRPATDRDAREPEPAAREPRRQRE